MTSSRGNIFFGAEQAADIGKISFEGIDVPVVFQGLHRLLGAIDAGDDAGQFQPFDGILEFCQPSARFDQLVLKTGIFPGELYGNVVID